MTTHRGGCHCGRVRFEVDAPAVIEATECNCSICSKVGYLHLIVAQSDFRLLQGEDMKPNPSYYRADGVHLNEHGYLRLSTLVQNHVERASCCV